jgi:hypothetical protein
MWLLHVNVRVRGVASTRAPRCLAGAWPTPRFAKAGTAGTAIFGASRAGAPFALHARGRPSQARGETRIARQEEAEGQSQGQDKRQGAERGRPHLARAVNDEGAALGCARC